MMRDEAFHAILEAKYARIISAISELHGVSLEEAMDIFYHSPLLPLIEDGTADNFAVVCRNEYEAEEDPRNVTALYNYLAEYDLLSGVK